MAFPLEVIQRHTQNEITVEFDKKVTIVNEFEYSFEIEFLNSLSIDQESAPEINYDNPYPLLFISGDIYSKFKNFKSLAA